MFCPKISYLASTFTLIILENRKQPWWGHPSPDCGPDSLSANQTGLLEGKLSTVLVAAVAGPGPE